MCGLKYEYSTLHFKTGSKKSLVLSWNRFCVKTFVGLRKGAASFQWILEMYQSDWLYLTLTVAFDKSCALNLFYFQCSAVSGVFVLYTKCVSGRCWSLLEVVRDNWGFLHFILETRLILIQGDVFNFLSNTVQLYLACSVGAWTWEAWRWVWFLEGAQNKTKKTFHGRNEK